MSAKPKLNEDQKEAFKTIQKFLDHPAADTLVLKGHAGTGKTYLMQYLGKWLTDNKYDFTFLASTGRAAAVLRGKTGFKTSTVHREIYHFSKVDGVEEEIADDAPLEQYPQMTLQFLLRPRDDKKSLYIIDEASMLASEVNDGEEALVFGSGHLMFDLFESAGNNKIIFVGDPCQLPPINEPTSPALDMDWLAAQKRIAIAVTLQKIERTNAENDILVLAGAVRNMLSHPPFSNYPKLPASGLNNVTLHASDKELFQSYLNEYKLHGHDKTLAIARTNKTVSHINRAIRRDLYNGLDLPLQEGDILLVTQNNYAIPLTNGDFVKITQLGEVKTNSNLHFMSVKLKSILADEEFEILLSMDILYGDKGNFTREQQKALMVDFSRRMQKKKKKPNSEEFKKEMMSDPYLTCLRAKYGYAVTCHKAQGGEWDFVYLFLDSKMYGMQREELFRWWYTAITRTRQQLHLTQEWWIE